MHIIFLKNTKYFFIFFFDVEGVPLLLGDIHTPIIVVLVYTSRVRMGLRHEHIWKKIMNSITSLIYIK